MTKVLFSIFLKVIIGGTFLLLIIYVGIIVNLGNSSGILHSADAIIVLGSVHTDMATARALTGLSVYEKKFVPVMVLTGGIINSSVSEASIMYNAIQAKANQMPNILLDDDAKSTADNFRNAHKLLGTNFEKSKSIIIVTDQFHLLRSILLAHKNGFRNVQWVGTDLSYMSWSRRLGNYLRELKEVILNASSLV